jgi:hypothetical protein
MDWLIQQLFDGHSIRALPSQLTIDLLIEDRAKLLVFRLPADVPELHKKPPGCSITGLAATGVN